MADRIASGQVFKRSLRCPKGKFVILQMPGEAEAGSAEVQLATEIPEAPVPAEDYRIILGKANRLQMHANASFKALGQAVAQQQRLLTPLFS